MRLSRHEQQQRSYLDKSGLALLRGDVVTALGVAQGILPRATELLQAAVEGGAVHWYGRPQVYQTDDIMRSFLAIKLIESRAESGGEIDHDGRAGGVSPLIFP